MDMTLILLIITAAALLIPVLRGYYRGFLATVLSLVSIVLSISLVGVLQPMIRNALQERTALETTIETALETRFGEEVQKALQESGLAKAGSSLSAVPLTQEMQDTLTQALNLPSSWQKFYQTSLQDSAQDFVGNISHSASRMALDAASYVLTFLLISLIIRFLFAFFGIVGRLPVIHGINKLLGAGIGLAEGLLLLWVLCRVATAFLPSGIGPEVMEAIQGNPVLSFLYNALYPIGTTNLL